MEPANAGAVVRPNFPSYKIKFHQNYVLSVWNTDGYHLFKVNAVGVINQKYTKWRRNDSEAMIVEALSFSDAFGMENMIALIKQNPVGVTPILELQRYEACIETIRPTIMFKRPVLSCTSSKECLAVCLERTIYIYRIGREGSFVTKSERFVRTETNEHGICAISDKYLVFPCTPSSETRGIIDIRKLNKQLVRHILLYAHNNHPVIALAFSSSGTSLATASKRHIRVFTVGFYSRDWPRVYQFSIDTTEIPTLNFSRCAEYITCNGRSPVIYIFRLTEDNKLTNILAGVYHVHRPPVVYDYSVALYQPHPIHKVVAVRFKYRILYLYVFNEFGVYELYWYNHVLKRFVSFLIENMTRTLIPPPHQEA